MMRGIVMPRYFDPSCTIEMLRDKIEKDKARFCGENTFSNK